MTYVRAHAASAKCMVSRFREQLEQMDHRWFSDPSRRSASCPVRVVHLTRRVRRARHAKRVFAQVLIMIFPFTPPPPHHGGPTSLGRDVLPLKPGGEFLPLPFLAPSAACNRVLVSSSPPLPLVCLPFVKSFLRGVKEPKEEAFSHLFVCVPPPLLP